MQNYTATTPPIGVIGKICVTCTKKVVNSHKNKHTAMPLNRNTLSNIAVLEAPKALQRDIHIENKEEITIDKTNDILKQINEYLDQEKTKLKKGNDIT